MTPIEPHARWVRISHAVIGVSTLMLAFSGFVILMAHPRLYWGIAGNDLTPALIELPISRNYKHAGYTTPTPLTGNPDGPMSANRTYDIFNENGWGRSLHFLTAWFLAIPGLVYLLMGLARRHFSSWIWPTRDELSASNIRRDLAAHVRLQIPPASGGPSYGVLQKVSYALVIFVAAPLVTLTGLTLSPAVTAAFPVLLTMFGGYQSARTIHFVAFVLLMAFVLVHLMMVALSGFRRQLLGITLGGGR